MDPVWNNVNQANFMNNMKNAFQRSLDAMLSKTQQMLEAKQNQNNNRHHHLQAHYSNNNIKHNGQVYYGNNNNNNNNNHHQPHYTNNKPHHEAHYANNYGNNYQENYGNNYQAYNMNDTDDKSQVSSIINFPFAAQPPPIAAMSSLPEGQPPPLPPIVPISAFGIMNNNEYQQQRRKKVSPLDRIVTNAPKPSRYNVPPVNRPIPNFNRKRNHQLSDSLVIC